MEAVLQGTAGNAFMFACGYSMKMLGYFQDEDGVRGLGLVVKFYVPTVMLVNVPYVSVSTDSFWASLTAVSFVVLLFFVARYTFRYFFSGLHRHEIGQMQFCSLGSAVSLVGIPVVFSYYHEAGLAYLLAYDIANTFFTYGATTLCAEVYKPAVTDGVSEVQIMPNSWPSNSSAISADASLGDGLNGDAQVVTPKTSCIGDNAAPGSEVDIEGACGSIGGEKRISNASQAETTMSSCGEGSQAASSHKRNSWYQLAEHVQGRPREIGVLLFGAIKQPTITALCVGLIMRSASVTLDQLPLFVSSAARTISGSCGYVTFFVLGIFFSPQVLRRSPGLLRRALACLLIRYACAIAVCVVVQFIPLFTARLRQVVGICAMMPVPPIVIAHSALKNYDKEFAIVIVNASLPVSFFLSAGFALLMA